LPPLGLSGIAQATVLIQGGGNCYLLLHMVSRILRNGIPEYETQGYSNRKGE
jgi:hypothetical protein